MPCTWSEEGQAGIMGQLVMTKHSLDPEAIQQTQRISDESGKASCPVTLG
jgi:hypothetical protein